MKPTRKEIAKEILENMDLTKEQYISLCELYDELGLEKTASGTVIKDENGKA